MIATTETLIPLQEFTLSPSPAQADPVFDGHPYISIHCRSRPNSPVPADGTRARSSRNGGSEYWAHATHPSPAQEDFVQQLFGATPHGRLVCHLVTNALAITRKGEQTSRTRAWDAFVYNDTLFLHPPTVELDWSEAEFRDSVVAVLELAEESTDCDKIVIAMEKDRKDLTILFRAFLYVGFQVVAPEVYKHDDKFLLAGYQI